MRAKIGWITADRDPLFLAVAALTILEPLLFNRSVMDIFRLPKALVLWVGAVFILALLSVKVAGERRLLLPRGPLAWLPLLFLGLAGAATATSIAPTISVFGARQQYLGFITYAAVVVLFYAAWRAVPKERLAAWLAGAAGAALPVACLSLLQRLGLDYPFNFRAWIADRFGSTIGNPNFLGIYLAMALPLAVGLALTTGRRSRTAAAAWWGGSAIILIGLAQTKSLGAWLAVFLTTPALIAIDRWPKTGRRQLPALAAAGGALALIFGAGLIAYTDVSSTLGERAAIWQTGVKAVLNSPWLGTGPDTLRYILPGLQPLSLGGRVLGDAHNLYLTLGATLGLPALAVFVWLVLTVLAARLPANDQDRPLTLALKTAMVAYLIGQQFNPESIAAIALFWTVAGVAARQGAPPREVTVKSPGVGWLGLAATVGAAVWLAAAGAHLWRAESLIKAASIQPDLRASWDYALKAQDSWPYYDFYALFLFDRSASHIGKDPDITRAAQISVERAAGHNRMEADVYYARGEIHRLLAFRSDKLANNKRALADYARSLKLNPTKLPANYEIAKLYLDRGDKARARRHLDLLLEILPADDEHRPELVALRRRAE